MEISGSRASSFLLYREAQTGCSRLTLLAPAYSASIEHGLEAVQIVDSGCRIACYDTFEPQLPARLPCAVGFRDSGLS